MAIEICCPKCSYSALVSDRFAGRELNCRDCHHSFQCEGKPSASPLVERLLKSFVIFWAIFLGLFFIAFVTSLLFTGTKAATKFKNAPAPVETGKPATTP